MTNIPSDPNYPAKKSSTPESEEQPDYTNESGEEFSENLRNLNYDDPNVVEYMTNISNSFGSAMNSDLEEQHALQQKIKQDIEHPE